MKILQINSHYDQGGAARIVACIHRELLREGQESYVAYGRGKQSDDENTFLFSGRTDVYVSALMSRVTGINGWWNRKATKHLVQYIEKIHPDILHLHALHGYYLNIPMLFDYINSHKVPCVWTFHDCHAFVGNCGYPFECEKWRSGCGGCPHVHDYPSSLLFDFTGFMWRRKEGLFTASDMKVIVSPSEWLTGIAKQSFFGKYPCVTIHNGIDVQNTFYPRDKKKCREKYGFSMGEKIILGIAVGYNDPRKGVKYILRTARELEAEVRVILIGWNQKNDALLEGMGNITALSAIEDVDVLAEYYSMADVFALPSLAENYATVSLEAMACGTPVVGFDVGGIPEQLAGNKGIVVEAGNQEKFAEAIWKVISGESNLLSGEALAEVIREENSTGKMVEEYIRLYRNARERWQDLTDCFEIERKNV